ncbi:MAG: S1/P1 nuclease [Rubrivivax sp.]|jgi:hypothetical protein
MQRSRTRLALASTALALLATLHTRPAQAWGADGHRLVAQVAESRLQPAALAAVQQLLAQEPGATLASVSTWADEQRNPLTAAWHYLNFQRDADCRYARERQCIEDNCVVGALQNQTARLANPATPAAERLEALKYVVHFVGDVHQPLHAGFADDRGGNSFQLQAFDRGTNLHSLWDSGLLRNWPGGAEALNAAVQTAAAAPAPAGTPATWAEESCRIVALPGFYPASRTLDASYPAQWNATLPHRLAQAGQRLAAVLNEALGSAR